MRCDVFEYVELARELKDVGLSSFQGEVSPGRRETLQVFRKILFPPFPKGKFSGSSTLRDSLGGGGMKKIFHNLADR